MSTTEEDIWSREKSSFDSTERPSEETRAETTGEQGDSSAATYGLTMSQLSCSTADNEGFYIVHHKDEECPVPNVDKVEEVKPLTLEAANDISVRSAAAQTSMFINSELPPPPPMYSYTRAGMPQQQPFIFREINRIPNAHLLRTQYTSAGITKAGDRRGMPFRTSDMQSRSSTIDGDSRNMKRPQPREQNNNSLTEQNGLNVSTRSRSINSQRFRTTLKTSAQSSIVKRTYPLMHVSSQGVISLVISDNIVIETTIDRSLRIVAHNNFAMTMNARGTASAIQHPRANIVHSDTNVSAKFVAVNDKYAVFNADAILFATGHCKRGYLMSSNDGSKGIKEIPLELEKYASCNLDQDYTLRVFYNEIKEVDAQCLEPCYNIVRTSSYDYSETGVLTLCVNGMVITSHPSGELQIDARPRLITCNTTTGSVSMRCPAVDMAIEEDEKAYVKRGMKRVHVSRSGMVVSDGNCVASLDQFGNPISCT